MKRSRKRERKSNLKVDWEEFETKRRSFERGNRTRRRSFIRKTEAILEKCPTNSLAEAINREKRRRESLRRSQVNYGELLNAASFTEFMGSFHDKNQEGIQLTEFAAPD